MRAGREETNLIRPWLGISTGPFEVTFESFTKIECIQLFIFRRSVVIQMIVVRLLSFEWHPPEEASHGCQIKLISCRSRNCRSRNRSFLFLLFEDLFDGEVVQRHTFSKGVPNRRETSTVASLIR